jgi:hypothetical protein
MKLTFRLNFNSKLIVIVCIWSNIFSCYLSEQAFLDKRKDLEKTDLTFKVLREEIESSIKCQLKVEAEDQH